jgi:hypothetical protein
MDEIRELLERLSELSTEELADLEARIRTEAQTLRDGDLTDESLEQLGTLADQLDQVTARQAELTAEETARQQRADELAARFETDPDGASDEGDGEGEGDGDGEGEGEGDPDAGEGDPESEGEGEGDPAQTAAASRPTPGAIRNRARRTGTPDPTPESNVAELPVAVTAAADIPRIPAGQQLESMRDVGEAFMNRHRAFSGPAKAYEQVPVATFDYQYPEDRQLGQDPHQNMERIQAVTSPEAIVAAGGLCAPLTPRYDLADISVATRNVRDALAGFQATRGGVTWIPPLQLTDLDGAIGAWTVANDEAAVDDENVRKVCLRVECDPAQTAEIEAITSCLIFGNLGARTFPERVAEAVSKAMSFGARFAEKRLLASLITDSTAVSGGSEVLGATRDILTTLGRVASSYRQRHRTPTEFPLRVILSAWVRDLIRADLAREMPGAPSDRLRLADAEINGFFDALNVNITWALDGLDSTQDFAAQGAAAVVGWPDTVKALVFHEGAHIFLDGGTLDLGIVRDSTLNAANDYQMFSETFEATAFVGLESLVVSMDVCPSGETAGTADVPCPTGAGS